MDFRSMKNGLTRSIRRFPDKPGVSTIGAFRGAIEPKFSDRIRGQWQFLEARLFRAVPLSFHRPRNPFGQISWPQTRDTGSHVVLAPNIQLTLRLTPITNMFFEGNTSHFQSSRSMIAQGASILLRSALPDNSYQSFQSFSQTEMFSRTSVPAALLTGEYWSTFLNFKDRIRETGGQPGARSPGTSDGGVRPLTAIFRSFPLRALSRVSGSTNRPLLTTISIAVRDWTESLKSNLIHRLTEQRRVGQVRLLHEPADEKALRDWTGSMFSLPRLLTNAVEFDATSVHHSQLTRLTEDVTSSRRSFLALLYNSKFLNGMPSPERFSPNVTQKFVVSRSTGPEAIIRQIQYFGPSPDLSYAKSEAPQMQQVLTALRDAKPTHSEIKTPAPQLPSIAQLTSQVRQELEREIRIERERRGL